MPHGASWGHQKLVAVSSSPTRAERIAPVSQGAPPGQVGGVRSQIWVSGWGARRAWGQPWGGEGTEGAGRGFGRRGEGVPGSPAEDGRYRTWSWWGALCQAPALGGPSLPGAFRGWGQLQSEPRDAGCAQHQAPKTLRAAFCVAHPGCCRIFWAGSTGGAPPSCPRGEELGAEEPPSPTGEDRRCPCTPAHPAARAGVAVKGRGCGSCSAQELKIALLSGCGAVSTSARPGGAAPSGAQPWGHRCWGHFLP